MKKILFAAFAATLLAAGCQKTEVIGTTDHGPAMTFSTEMKKITKAEGDETPYTGELPEGNVNLQANGFNLWAFADYDLDVNSNNVDTGTKIYDGMSGLLVEYDVDTDSWDPGKEYYWPAEDRYLMFFALSAQSGTIPTGTMPTSGITTSYGDKDFTGAQIVIDDFQVSNTSPDNDLMVADFHKQNSAQNNKAVDLTFRHALTKVQFVFSTTTNPFDEDDQLIEGAPKVFVQKVEATGLKDIGDLTVTSEEAAEQKTTNDAIVGPISLEWDEKSLAASDENLVFTATWPVPNDNFPSEFENENGTVVKDPSDADVQSLLLNKTPTPFATWFMIPQSLDGAMVKITYVINKRQFSALFPLTGADDQITAWGVNQYVKYNISLTPDMILFDAEVSDWNPKTGDDKPLQN